MCGKRNLDEEDDDGGDGDVIDASGGGDGAEEQHHGDFCKYRDVGKTDRKLSMV